MKPGPNGLANTVKTPKFDRQKVVERQLLQRLWDLCRVGVDLKVVWEMSDFISPVLRRTVPDQDVTL